jgi:uncharacterized protein YqgC (DUF456 family)
MWAALGKAAVGAVKGGAKKIAADKLLNRKKKTDARRAAAQKMMGGGEEKGGAIVVRPKAALVHSPAGAIEKYSGGDQQQSGGGEDLQGLVLHIKTSVISVESLLGNSVALQQKQLDDQRKAREAAQLGKAEKDLEKKKPKVASKGPKLNLPGKGLLSSIMDFVINIAFGWIAVRLLKFGPQLAKILPAIGAFADFMVDGALLVLTGLTTLVHWGYKFVEMGRGLVKGVFGEEGAKKFDTFVTNLKNLISGFLVWKIIGEKIFKALVQNIKNTYKVIRGVFAKAGKFLNWMTGGRAGNLAKNVLSKGKGVLTKVGSTIGKKLGLGGVKKLGGSLMKKGAGGLLKRVGLKVFGKAFVKTASKIFGRIPIVGPLIVGIVSLVSGEPIGQALFKTIGAAVGGLLGTFIPIPVIGTLLGEAIGVFVGDLLYHLIVKRDPKAAFQMLKDTLMKIFSAGKAIFNFFKDGFVRFIEDFPTVPVPDIKPGEILANFINKIPVYKQIMNTQVPDWKILPKWIRGFSLRKLLDGLPSTQQFLGMFAQFIPGLNKYVKDGKLTRIPNVALLTPMGAPFLIPHLGKSFLPGLFGGDSGGAPDDAKTFAGSSGGTQEALKQEDPLEKERKKLKEKSKKLDEKSKKLDALYKKKLNNMQLALGDFVIGVGDAMKIEIEGGEKKEDNAPVINKTNEHMDNKIQSVSKEASYEENVSEVVEVPVVVNTGGVNQTTSAVPVISGTGGGGDDPYEVLDFQG